MMRRSMPTEIPTINLKPLTTPVKAEDTLMKIHFHKTNLTLGPSEKWILICQLLKQFGVQVQGTSIELPWTEKDKIFIAYLLNIFTKLIGSSVYCQYFAGRKCWKFGVTMT